MERVCRVAISGARYGFDKLYDYDIPEHLVGKIRPGMRVVVPFGAGSRQREAFVVRMGCDPNTAFQRKELCAVLDEQPVLDEKLLRLAAHMCSTLFCTFYDCARAMLPAGLWFHKIEYWTLSETISEEQRKVLAEQEPILKVYSKRKRTASFKELRKKIPDDDLQARLDALCRQEILCFSSEFDRKVNDKTVRMIGLAMSEEEARAAAEKGRSAVRQDVVQALIQEGQLSKYDLQYLTAVSDGVLRTMIRQGILQEWEEEVFRLPEQETVPRKQDFVLNEEQQTAYQRLYSLLHTGKPEAALLFGVTGSGKTQVYLKLIQSALEQGKSAIVLVPEIGLTPQMIRRFMAQFGDCTAVLHSALSAGERYDSWKRIRSGQARVVVGTRSAVFAPVQNLGVIILDEEQDDAYKSEHNPKYHARDIAKYRAVQENALVVFGSATPSVETFYGAEQGKYPMLALRQRYAGAALPVVTIADMRGLVREGYTGAVGPILRREIEQCLDAEKQCILFLNRRGAAKQVTCTACGWVPECDSCSISMSYHSANGRLMCHYCGHSVPLPTICPNCGSTHLKTEGVGTQRLETELHEMFPDVKIFRMDADTTGTKNSHARILSAFEQEKTGILLGTQMITKGLDFDRVTLVGIIDADQGLFAQDYRARERTFSLLTQVVGRAGRRGDSCGHAVIQTYSPKNSVILNAARQDYEEFYETEIELRHALQCPPAAQIVMLTASGEREQEVLAALIAVKTRLESLMAGQFADFCYPVLGPAPAGIVRLQNRYRYHLAIRCPDGKRRRELIGGILREFAANRTWKSVSLSVDINPAQI